MVVSVPDYATALTLTGDEQQQVGLYCGNIFATVYQPLRGCTSPHYGATLIHIASPGTYNADRNPSRIAPRNLFDMALGTNHLWAKDNYAIGPSLVVNSWTTEHSIISVGLARTF